jgi:hypothetical protein
MEVTVMHPLTSYELAKLQMAERHAEADRARLAKIARGANLSSGDDEHEASFWRRWTLRRLVGRVTLAPAHP